MQRERRKHERLSVPPQSDAVNLQLLWAPLEEYDADDVCLVDISEGGIAVLTHNRFQVGDSIRLSVTTQSLSSLSLSAIICNRQIWGDGFRYGAYFEYDGKLGDPRAEEMLDMLKAEVRNHQTSAET